MQILFLDDDATRIKTFTNYFPDAMIVETAFACIEELKNQDWDVVCLDHDLGGEVYCDSTREDTGMEVVRWIKGTMFRPESNDVGQFLVHSFNHSVTHIMADDLRKAGYNAVIEPFGPRLIQTVKRIEETYNDKS